MRVFALKLFIRTYKDPTNKNWDSDALINNAGQQTVTGDGTRPQGLPGRVPPNSGRRAVSPRGTYVTLLQCQK